MSTNTAIARCVCLVKTLVANLFKVRCCAKVGPPVVGTNTIMALEYYLLEEVFDLARNIVIALRANMGQVTYHDVRVQPATNPTIKNKGGRPPKLTDEFWVEVALQAALDGLEGLEPEHRKEFHSRIMEFCERRWGVNAPKDSTVRNALSKLYKRLPR